MEAETRFHAMGSDVHVIVVGGPLSLLETAREFIDDLESRWSRFRSDSEISRLNDAAGRPVRVSSLTVALVQRAIEGSRITGGRYDPTVLGAVIRAGYDRSFELLGTETLGAHSVLGLGLEGIVVEETTSTVTLPSGVGFDPGGIGKGYAADLVVRELLSQGAAGACASVGGDLRVDGDAPDGDSWTICIDHPLRPGANELIGLRSGAVATSTRARRAWGPKHDRRHHLIDPATGRPARSGLLSAAVIAAEGWQAEVVAKAAFIAGLAEGLFLLASTGTDGLLIDDHGSVYPSAGFDRFTGGNHPLNPFGDGGLALEGSVR
jgi:thiamine biosynthesis lipoprotein